MRRTLLALTLLSTGCGTVGWTSTDTGGAPPVSLAPVYSGAVAVQLEVKNFPESGPGSDRRIRWARAFVNAEPNGVFSFGNSPLVFDHQVVRRTMDTVREVLPAAELRKHRTGEPRVEIKIQRGIPRANRVINQVWSRVSYLTLTTLPHWGRDVISVRANLVDPSGKILAKVGAEATYHQLTWSLMVVPWAFLEVEEPPAAPTGAACKAPARAPRRKPQRGSHVNAVDAAIRLCMARLAKHPAWQAPPQ